MIYGEFIKVKISEQEMKLLFPGNKFFKQKEYELPKTLALDFIEINEKFWEIQNEVSAYIETQENFSGEIKK